MPARTDRTQDVAVLDQLAVVRLGTAFFRRTLDRLPNLELDRDSLLPGWSRRHVVAHVGYNARAVARLVTWADTGIETPMYSSPRARGEEIDLGATLSAEALRKLVEHAAIDLDVRWRDLAPDAWSTEVTTAQGRVVPASETVWMRTREVWLHAIDLDWGARFDQVPPAVLHRLIGDVHQAWSKRAGLAVPSLTVAGPGAGSWQGSPDGVGVVGPLGLVAAWVTGRLDATRWDELSWTGPGPQAAPRWI